MTFWKNKGKYFRKEQKNFETFAVYIDNDFDDTRDGDIQFLANIDKYGLNKAIEKWEQQLEDIDSNLFWLITESDLTKGPQQQYTFDSVSSRPNLWTFYRNPEPKEYNRGGKQQYIAVFPFQYVKKVHGKRIPYQKEYLKNIEGNR